MAPDLVRIQRHFEKDGVVFVSLTPVGEADARRFADRHHIGWPTGWGAQDVVRRYLGDRYPTLLVVGRDGRVVWNDGTGRLQHRQEDSAVQLIMHVEQAL
ncbi:MAG TPA: hypothetical protein VG826_21575 [Pirellulales bacterium]|nr:hypothetical protein [Pirellulales bacterium]